MQSETPLTLILSPLRYLFTVVGTARCAVRAAFSGASTWPGRRGARSVPPAARGRGRRSAASLPTNYVRTVNRYQARRRRDARATTVLISHSQSKRGSSLHDEPRESTF